MSSRRIPALPYAPVVHFPKSTPVHVLNLTSSAPQQSTTPRSEWTIGKYDEDRTIYNQPLFGGQRTVHVGVDLGGPVNTPIHAFWKGKVLFTGINASDGDYGPTIVTEHRLADPEGNGAPAVLYALFGHLAVESLSQSKPGMEFEKGDVLGWIGDSKVNGGWPPHLHFQLSWKRPDTHDMPGAVARGDRSEALRTYPDPRLVLGMIYQDNDEEVVFSSSSL